MLPNETRHLHFIGIGGAGMSGIAWVLLKSGYQISGSDMAENRLTQRLRDNGANVHIGHHADNLPDSAAVVISTAIQPDNPELLAAQQRDLHICHRSDALDEIMRQGLSIAVAGTHGKTTTTSMMVLAAIACGLDPTVLIGGELNDIGGNAKAGNSNLIIAEADESDGSFLRYEPHYSIVTNVEPDHLDYYGSEQAMIDAFRKYLNQTRPDGCAILCLDDERLRGFLPQLEVPLRTYGLTSDQANFFANDLQSDKTGVSYSLIIDGKQHGRVNLRVQGAFNVANSLAVLAVCEELGADRQRAIGALEDFRGVVRRFQVKGRSHGITVIDDYAHHPTEVQVTLESAQSYCRAHDGGRVISVFQPHRYSRTQHLGEQFGPAFTDAQEVVITDVYAAGEPPLAGISGQLVYDSIVRAGHPNVNYVPAKEQVIDFLADHLDDGDMVLTLGAGDIWQVGEDLLERLDHPPKGDGIRS
ncbi:UDP-N-acetylmuramate--L-alanine ligase [Candidatus Sumerlaeota bacterium]